jgi:DNA modification methylase
MINKRLLVKNLLAHHGENSFYDKKRRIDISTKEGKAKFLKHVCALANSNPKNNAYILIGVEDQNNEVVGVDFFDDSRIQNLVNAYLNHPPQIIYENILFPALPPGKVVGLVTIRSLGAVCSLRKNIWKYGVGGGNTGHPAVFPEQLAEDHIISWSNEGDIVLDPMCGSGTTCKMAKINNRKYIGIDISEEYCQIARERIEKIS